MRFFITLLLAVALCANTALAQQSDTNKSIEKTETSSGHFYSSPLSLEQEFPFSDIVETAGGLVFFSGLVGTDEHGELVPGGLQAETHAIFRQMSIYLEHLNLDFTDIVKCLVMIDDIEKWSDFNELYTQYFSPPYPARSAMGADGLALGASLELECIAARR